MNRREFFHNAFKLGFAGIGAVLIGGRLEEAFADGSAGEPELVAVRGGEPDVMFDAAIAAFGGMGRFVKKGQKVLVKPNIGWSREPEYGANTNPKLVARIVRRCIEAGASKVTVFDHTCDNWRNCYKLSGISEAVRSAGGTVVTADEERYYREVTIPGAKVLKKALVHEALIDADVFVNVPILKSHGSTRITVGMKNLMGTVWDRGWWHANNLDQCIVDFMRFRRPDLTVVDAYRVMTEHGPRGLSKDGVVVKKNLLLARDIVLADAAAAKVFGLEPSEVRHIAYAHEQNIGRMNTEGRVIRKIAL